MYKRLFIRTFLAIFLLAAMNAFAAAQNCVNPKITGKHNKADIEKLAKMVPGYLQAYRAGDIKAIASYIDRKRVNKIANRFLKRHSNEKSKQKLSGIETVCVSEIEVFDTFIYARLKGRLSYKAEKRKQPREFYFFVRKKKGEFQFSDMKFVENSKKKARR